MMLAADLQLRSQSGGKYSLDSALEQFARCCAAQARRWSAQEIIARLDELTGTTIFGDIVRAQFESNGYPDYEAVLKRAGIKVEGMDVEFDPAAPWAAERDAVMRTGH
jgi:predicted metalloprotease with PDZ domain